MPLGLTVEVEPEEDGRWLAEVPGLSLVRRVDHLAVLRVS